MSELRDDTDAVDHEYTFLRDMFAVSAKKIVVPSGTVKTYKWVQSVNLRLDLVSSTI